jgi:ATP-dependent Lon protease
MSPSHQLVVYLSAHETKSRLEAATSIFLKQANIAEVSTKISNAVDESLSKQQKEFFLRQQLAAIQRELQALNRVSTTSPSGPIGGPGFGGGLNDLGDDEQAEADDLVDLKRRIEAMEQGSEERKVGVREWRRLKRIPQGSVENGVIRSYVSFLLVSLMLSALKLTREYSWNGSALYHGQIQPNPLPHLHHQYQHKLS